MYRVYTFIYKHIFESLKKMGQIVFLELIKILSVTVQKSLKPSVKEAHNK